MLRTDTGYARNLNWVFVAFIMVVLALAVWQIRNILLLALAAVLLTIFASMPVRFLINRGLGRSAAILLSLVGGVFAVIVLSLLVFPTLLEQFRVLFAEVIPRGIDQLIELWNKGEILQQLPIPKETLESFQNFEIDPNMISQAIGQIASALGEFSGSVIPLLGDVASALLSFLIIIFLCLYLIAEPDLYIDGLIRLTPLWYRQRTREILARLDDTVRAWVRVTGVSMFITGLGTAIGLALLGIQQWAALGVLAGVMSFIPNFGPIVALVPSIAVAIIQAPQYTLLVVVIIYGVSFVQSQIFAPILARESMKLAPVLILVGQIVFGVFFGFMGIMLAVPLTAMLVVIIEEVYIKDILGDYREVLKTKDTVEPYQGFVDEPLAEAD